MDRSDEIAIAYVKLFSSEEGTSEYEECFWAFDALEELTRLAPALFVDQIDRILVLDAGDDLIGYLGAGPLEDFLALHGDTHGHQVFAKIRQDVNWRRMARTVWRSTISDSVWQELQRLCN